MLSPVLGEIADEYADVLKVAKVNVDDEPELAMKFKVSSIPMLVLFKDGRIISTSHNTRWIICFSRLSAFIKKSSSLPNLAAMNCF